MEKGDALLEETRSFVSAILADTVVPVSGRDGLRALDLAEKIIHDAQRRLA